MADLIHINVLRVWVIDRRHAGAADSVSKGIFTSKVAMGIYPVLYGGWQRFLYERDRPGARPPTYAILHSGLGSVRVRDRQGWELVVILTASEFKTGLLTNMATYKTALPKVEDLDGFCFTRMPSQRQTGRR
ncbi:hypothetical protein HJFPF1_09019 [Paramyrothecium foliicola]|nr:hypothetical protein HJFPF1_09019 [Paramyrothecium foliicola]